MTTILAPISIGELIDKITILELKKEYIQDDLKHKNIQRELDELTLIYSELTIALELLTVLSGKRDQLKSVNRELWHIENAKRQAEKDQLFGPQFIQTARNVYLKNDLRAQIKREINLLLDSGIIEEKSY